MKQSISLNAARAFIEAHFDEPVTLAQLAALSALSVSRFATVFRQQYGSSPYRYLCGLRIQRAQTLLLEGVPGSVVATEVGFFDQSHFGRHFKRCCGMTPSMFIARAGANAAKNAVKHGGVVQATAPRSASAITSSC
ncbi:MULTISPECIES: helix-turn-helix domain-containing protein [Paraburkholderia]|jgi:AraC-like DNA-binding protein|uniref:HTH-type transcriptional activator RhaR n=1 Tax=Paraburkholderia aspalathi TaxID=1324617 RepID=A0A1I7EI77_9BURK|nr:MULTISPECIES: AraC family transcriptional regulator [Paraburkholderia]MCP2090337.1 AraC-like DNA-binding protein [Paraburkholderia sediminicola]MBK3818916.1 helix-turn-helix transcriptional regulator [Paraburkholderia aspalathi]MBK3830816.1 helix-turn-helix transcriptional regulator [Paraburkholderia aspalathi]MBK3837985.1 helix-turn-helix transcriptional regulator [Paraburkholderia aspalathi]MBK3860471.1 helix-turn-helix transcriptional regulator [Paraburkholderia aspalathi]